MSVAVSGGDVPDINIGFAYNLIVNTGNSGQGSLRQFIANANAIGSASGTTANLSEFRIPATDPGFAAGVAVIAPSTDLPVITDGGTKSTVRPKRRTTATRTLQFLAPAAPSV